jgi:hypothetical protein
VSGSATAPEPGNVCDNFNIIIQHFSSEVVLHGTDPSALLKLLDMNKLRRQINSLPVQFWIWIVKSRESDYNPLETKCNQ